MSSISDSHLSNKSFALEKLGKYKKLINETLNQKFSTIPRNMYPKEYDIHKAVDSAFLDVLHRGGKRLRGALSICAYELFNKTSFNKDIYTLAASIEIFATYLLVIDDVDDQSLFRRGKLTAHQMLSKFKNNYNSKRDSSKFGNIMAIYSAIMAKHSMENMIMNTSFDDGVKLKVLNSFNDTLHTAAYGQLLEAYLELTSESSSEDVLTVHEYKTGYYTIYSPLEIGAIVAGASQKEIDALKEFAISIGIAFQLRDDILGLYGDSKITGKPAIDDLKEGKMTLLMTYALENASKTQKQTLLEILGNNNITENTLKTAQNIVKETGSYKYSEDMIKNLVIKAKASLLNTFKDKQDHDSIRFLLGISDYMVNRNK